MAERVRDQKNRSRQARGQRDAWPHRAGAPAAGGFFSAEDIIRFNPTDQPAFDRIEANLRAVPDHLLPPELRRKLDAVREQFAALRQEWQEVADDGR